jgi:hypothetical protein
MFKFLWLLFKFVVHNFIFTKNTLPAGLSDITAQWLTKALQQSSILDSNALVEPRNSAQLDGGVHSQVYRFDLYYKNLKLSAEGGCTGNHMTICSPSVKGSNSTPEMQRVANEIIANGCDNQQDAVARKHPATIVVKVTAMKLSVWGRFLVLLKKEFGVLRDKMVINATSYEKETNFYKTLASSNSFPIHTPKCYYVTEDYFRLRFVLVLEDLSPLERGEPHGFRVPHAKLALRNLARLHASFWNSPMLPKLNIWDLGGYWIGHKEGALEKKNIKVAWTRTLVNLRDVLSLADIDSSTLNELGTKLEQHLTFITSATTQNLRTLIHGDYKISNLFIDPTLSRVSTIDWQWVGRGCNATEVMYFLHTSIHIDDLKNDTTRKELLEYYYHSLQEFGIGAAEYPFDMFLKEYELSLLDFFVFVVTSKWAHMGPREVEKYAEKRKDGLHLRSLQHIEWLIRQTICFSKKYLIDD